MSKVIFLSAVTNEFGDLRARLARVIQRTNKAHVRHQDDFVKRGVMTLEALKEEIEASDVVIHLIGEETGDSAPADQFEGLLKQLPQFERRFPLVAAEGRKGLVSYTQWEAWLAFFLGKRLCGFVRSKALETPMQSSQRMHESRLRHYEVYPKATETDDELYDEVLLFLIEMGILTKREAFQPNAGENSPSDDVLNPFGSFGVECPPNMYIGRRKELAEAVRTLRSTIFIGEAKSGKTNLLLRLRDRLLVESVHPIEICSIYITPKNVRFSSASEIFSYIYDQLKIFIRRKLGFDPQDAEFSGVKRVIELLQQCERENRRLRVVLLVDDLDKYDRYDQNKTELFQGLRQLIDGSPLEQHVAVVGTSTGTFLSSEDKVTSTLLSRLEPAMFLGPFSQEDCALFVSKAEPFVPGGDLTPGFYQRVYDATGGQPFLVQSLMFRIVELVRNRGLLLSNAINEAQQDLDSLVPVFEQWLQHSSFEESTYFLALSWGLDTEKAHLAKSSMDRFLSMGIIQLTDTPARVPKMSCKLFYDWIARNSRKLVRLSESSLSLVNDVVSITTLLQTTLRHAIGEKPPPNNRVVQEQVRAILAAHQLAFETPTQNAESGFLLPQFNLFISVLLVQANRSLPETIDDILADCRKYSSEYPNVICVCYDLTGRLTRESLFHDSQLQDVRVIIIQHRADEGQPDV